MQPQRSESPPPQIAAALRAARDTDLDREQSVRAQAAVLGLLLGEDAHSGLWAEQELQRALSADALEVTDAIGELIADGLAHRFGDFVLASRAARSFDRLEL
ncbi:MAG: hypothetical protein ACRDK4_02510 [Solirubrobacteraceae bacterium]